MAITDRVIYGEDVDFCNAFKRNDLWEICDEGVNDDTIKRLTKRINGGYNGLKHRREETKKIYEWLR